MTRIAVRVTFSEDTQEDASRVVFISLPAGQDPAALPILDLMSRAADALIAELSSSAQVMISQAEILPEAATAA